MNKLAWILGVACLGAAGYVLWSEIAERNLQPVDGWDEASARVGAWGTGKRVTGIGGQLGGKLKQGVGRLTKDPDVESEGVVDEFTGKVKDAAGQAAHAVSDTIHDLNS
jgi:uncharacterized protein YjbJ (UPF0337 family)